MHALPKTLAALAVAGTLSLTTIAPASADGAASTRNIILGVAALAGLAIESNVAHKNAQAGTLTGYLPDGSAVYGDGRVVAPNGTSYYPSSDGQTVSCSNGACTLVALGPNSPNAGYIGMPRNSVGAGNGYYDANGNWVNANPALRYPSAAVRVAP